MRISDWSSDVCSSDLAADQQHHRLAGLDAGQRLIKRGNAADRLVAHAQHDVAGLQAGLARGQPVDAGDADAFAGFQPCLAAVRSEEHTSELQSLMRTSYAGFCLQKKKL